MKEIIMYGGCPACQDKRMHNDSEWEVFHPLNRHGYNKEQGFSKPGLGFVSDVHKGFDPSEPVRSKDIKA